MPYLGDIILFPTNAKGLVPNGYAPCDGRSLPRPPNTALGYLLGQPSAPSVTLPDLAPPATGVHYLMAVTGAFPSTQSQGPLSGSLGYANLPTGSIVLVAFERGLTQWLPCSGQQLPTSQYPALAYAQGVGTPQVTVPSLTPPTTSMAYVINVAGPSPWMVGPPGGAASAPSSTSAPTSTSTTNPTTTTTSTTTTACPT